MSAILKSLDLTKALKWAEKKAGTDRKYLSNISAQLWNNYLLELPNWVKIPEGLLLKARRLTRPDNIGFEQGQVRPGEVGRFDVWANLDEGPMPISPEYIALCNITPWEVAESEKDWDPRFMQEEHDRVIKELEMTHLSTEQRIALLEIAIFTL